MRAAAVYIHYALARAQLSFVISKLILMSCPSKVTSISTQTAFRKSVCYTTPLPVSSISVHRKSYAIVEKNLPREYSVSLLISVNR